MSRIIAVCLTILAATLSGCSDAPRESRQSDTSPELQAAPVPWTITVQRDLGIYAGVQVLGLRYWSPEPGYCRSLTFNVPLGSTQLDFTFNVTTEAGVLGFGARSDSREQWEDYPDVYNPQHSFLDNPKRLSFTDPEPSEWTVTAITQGPAYQAIGNLTIHLTGVSGEPPADLGIQMIGPDSQPCKTA